MTREKSASDLGDEYNPPISPEEPAELPRMAGGRGCPIEIIISFNTTGSMYPALVELRKNVKELIRRLQSDIPNIRIGFIAHGDYCDESTSYVIKMLDFTRDTDELINFVKRVGKTGGGSDGKACYELALKTARVQFSWTALYLRPMIVIGDSNPHSPDFHFYEDHTPIDWEREAVLLSNSGIHIYGVFCNKDDKSGPQTFYRTMAEKTREGTFLELKDFKNIFDMICAICYREQGAEYYSAFEKEVRDREGGTVSQDLDSMLVTLRTNTAPIVPRKNPSSKARLKRATPKFSSRFSKRLHSLSRKRVRRS